MSLLDGRVAVVTGAAGGIGAGCARALTEAGAAVAVCDLDEGGESVAAEIAEVSGGTVGWWKVDVRDAAAVKAFVDDAAGAYGGIDVVVANAGIWCSTDPLRDDWDTSVELFDLMVGTNLRGVYLTGRAAIPHLVRRGGGDIVNIATDHICPPPGFATGGGTRMDAYDASKWGINGITQAWAKRLAEHRIRVNALCMDAVDSGMSRYAAGDGATPEVVARWMTPAQIGQLLLDLLAEGPDGRTGENIGIWRGHPIELPPRRDLLPSRHR